MARADARRRYTGDAWALGGGLLGGGAMFVGGIIGLITTYDFIGVMLGVGAGALPAPLLLSLLPLSVSETPQLEDAAPGQRVIYRQTFIAESRKLRARSVFIAELVAVAVGGGLLLLLIF